MNRIDALFATRSDNILSVYFTAGFPSVDDTLPLAQTAQESGADMIEIGMPFSDPIADGPVIQRCNSVALRNGMTVERLFAQLASLRASVSIPVLLMGYLNPVLQFGVDRFLDSCADCGVDGVIIPDWPWDERDAQLFDSRNLHRVLLVAPQTTEERLREIDRRSRGFLYAVSSFGTTGQTSVSDDSIAFLQRLASMKLRNPVLVGFGIRTAHDLARIRPYGSGAIVGSAFLENITEAQPTLSARSFIQTVRRTA